MLLFTTPAIAKDFDYYLLALSWSPAYCAIHNNQEKQCLQHRSFILHGLWPQYKAGGYPHDCNKGDSSWVSEETINHMMDVMPKKNLIIHEYKKHGTCTGLSPEEYFEKARRAYQKITIPKELKSVKDDQTLGASELTDMFVRANPKLAAEDIQLVCVGNWLSEIRVCLSKDLTPTSCTEANKCYGDIFVRKQ